MMFAVMLGRRDMSDAGSTRAKRALCKALGVPVIFAGLVFLCMGGWLCWGTWVKLVRWPQVDATLVSKDVSEVGARLVFHYYASGHRVTGVGFVWGSPASVGSALESWVRGTTHRISYDPKEPSELEPMHDYAWGRWGGPVGSALLGAVFLFGGVFVYRGSYGNSDASPHPEESASG
jgi:hypothetical protein